MSNRRFQMFTVHQGGRDLVLCRGDDRLPSRLTVLDDGQRNLAAAGYVIIVIVATCAQPV